jgi:hypothetical protein
MKPDKLEAQVLELGKTIENVENKIQRVEDIDLVKKLQRAYGYYLEHWQEEELIGLFSHSPDVTVEINDFGEFKGWEAVKSCFNFADHYPNYPGATKAPGEYLHILIPNAGIVDLEPDGKYAKGRWYGIFLGAQHRGGALRALIGAGIWENEYVKENGVWKIMKIFWTDIISSPLDEGWVKTPDLLNPKHKHSPPAVRNINFAPYPSGYIFPYHYKNPVTGK